MTETRLEDMLRQTLAEAAATVTSGPTWSEDAATSFVVRPTRTVRRRLSWAAPLAAAATVALLVVGLLVAQHHRPHVAPPATNSPTSSQTHSPSPTTSTPGSNAPRAVAVALPSEWKDALSQPGQDFGALDAIPLSVAADGTVVLYLDFGPDWGRPRQVALLRPGTSAPEVVYTVDDPDSYKVTLGALYGRQLVVGTSLGGRSPQGTVPGSSPMPNVHQLLVIDLDTGAKTTIASTTPGKGLQIDEAAVFGDTVYWVSRPTYAATEVTYHGYNLVSHKSKKLAWGGLGQDPTLTPLGIYSFVGSGGVANAELPHTGVRRELDRVIPHTQDSRVSLVTDGKNYAWLQDSRTVAWWSPGKSERLFQLTPRTAGSPAPLLVVSGPLVFIGDNPWRVLDTRTGAIAKLPTAFGFTLYAAMPQTASNESVVAATNYIRSGAWVDRYWVDGKNELLILDISALPKISR
jgi:hypothetical protein